MKTEVKGFIGLTVVWVGASSLIGTLINAMFGWGFMAGSMSFIVFALIIVMKKGEKDDGDHKNVS